MQEILNIYLFITRAGNLRKDKLKWTLTRNGEFSVKSLYAKLLNPSILVSHETKRFWKGLWSMDTSQRIKLFIWKCLQDALTTKTKIKSALYEDNNCVFCNSERNLLITCFLNVYMQEMFRIYLQCHHREYILYLTVNLS